MFTTKQSSALTHARVWNKFARRVQQRLKRSKQDHEKRSAHPLTELFERCTQFSVHLEA
jgi:hypothetical protein